MPFRTILATIGLVFASLLAVYVVYVASRVVIWIVVAGFFAVVLVRPVGALQHRFGLRRGVAIALVVGSTVLLAAGLLVLFVLPVRRQLIAALTDLPGTVSQAADGQGPFGRLVTRLNIESLVRDHEERLLAAAATVQRSFPSLLGSAVQAALAVVTITVVTCLLLSQSDVLARAAVRLLPVRHRDRTTVVARSAARAVSGYMIGNLIISVCAGVAAFVFLLIARVPNAALLALWVAFADLIPLVGATMGAVVAVLGAFLVSPTVGVVAIVFFLAYQQFENSVLQIVIMARTVRVNPLVVLVSVLVGVELFGFVGAVLAIPIAGAASVALKELWVHGRRDPSGLIVVTTAGDDLDDTADTPRRRLGRRRAAKRHSVQAPPG